MDDWFDPQQLDTEFQGLQFIDDPLLEKFWSMEDQFCSHKLDGAFQGFAGLKGTLWCKM